MIKDPVHKKIMKTRKRFIEDDSFDPDEAMTAAIEEKISFPTYFRRETTFLRQ